MVMALVYCDLYVVSIAFDLGFIYLVAWLFAVVFRYGCLMVLGFVC